METNSTNLTCDEEQSLIMKDLANKELKNGNIKQAIDLYTESISLNSCNPILYGNRALAYFRSEAFGLAIEDATKAIELDKNYVKAYYRRAIAFTAISKSEDALKDFQVSVNLNPNDAFLIQKLKECRKIIQKNKFEKAIEVQNPPSVFDNLDIASISLDASYDGPVILERITEEFINYMISTFRECQKLPLRFIYRIISSVRDILRNERTMNEINVCENVEVIVVGDTHGQFFDVLSIFETFGYPNKSLIYIFNGDFVDRGSWSLEVALLLFALKWKDPSTIYLNRGNHETDDMNKLYGFEGECKAKYNEKLFKMFSETFSVLPLAALVGQVYFIVHGGLFSNDDVTLDDIRRFDRFSKRQPGQKGLMMEMLWADPQKLPGRAPSKRGVGLQFGPDVTKRFCESNKIKAVIRSHEVREEGFEIEHDGRCITIFSAPNYCDQFGNKGAIIKIDQKLDLKFQKFESVPHPDIKPMAYASNLMMM